MVVISKAKLLKCEHKYRINCNSIARYFEVSTQYTKWHGVKVIGEANRTFLERSMWILVLITSVIICSYFINKAYQKWQQTPIVMEIYNKQVSIDEIPFPAVTICPAMEINTDDAQIKLDGFLPQYLESWYLLENSSSTNNASPPKGANKTDLLDFIYNNTPGMNEIFAACSWNGVVFDCATLLTKVFTEYGVCYTFNSIDRSQMLYNNISNSKDFNQAAPSSCYSDFDKSCKAEYPPKGVSQDAEGLVIQLKPPPQRKNPYVDTKVIIHKPNELPIMNAKFYGLRPSAKRVLSISPQVILTQNSLRSYLPTQRSCYFNGEKKLDHFKYYTQKNCETECLLSKINPEKENVKKLKRNSHNGSPNDYNTLEVPTELNIMCDCYADCESLIYDVTYLATSEDFEDESSEVQVYFEYKDFLPYHRVPMFSTMDFIVYSANYFCVFMGFSFLLIFETAYLMCVRPLTNILIRRKRLKQIPKKIGGGYNLGLIEL